MDKESTTNLNLCNVGLFGFTISIFVLFMGVIGFLFYVMSEFTTSFMIIVSSLTVFVELAFYRPIICLVFASLFKFKLQMMNLGRKSDRF